MPILIVKIMHYHKVIQIIPFTLIIISMLATIPACADCGHLIQQVHTAIDQSQLDRLQPLLKQLHQHADCPHQFLRDAERAAAQIAAQQALAMVHKKQWVAAGARLQQAPVSTWETQYVHGEIASAQDQWPQAMRYYQQALALAAKATTPPPAQTTELLRKLIAETQLLAGEADFTARSSGAVPWPVPVQFKTDYPKSGRLDTPGITATGLRNAKRLAKYIQKQKLSRLLLIGHTDERGSEEYNFKLSQRRACALKDFLHQQGVTAEIVAQGKGESEPMNLSDEDRYDTEEIWALQRRVEFLEVNEESHQSLSSRGRFVRLCMRPLSVNNNTETGHAIALVIEDDIDLDRLLAAFGRPQTRDLQVIDRDQADAFMNTLAQTLNGTLGTADYRNTVR